MNVEIEVQRMAKRFAFAGLAPCASAIRILVARACVRVAEGGCSEVEARATLDRIGNDAIHHACKVVSRAS